MITALITPSELAFSKMLLYIMSVIMAHYADQPCNHLWMGVLRDKQDFFWNEWV